MRRSKNKPSKQVISRRAMLRHLDLKSSNEMSKPISAKILKFKPNHGKSCDNDVKTSKAQSLYYVNDCNSTPSTKLHSEPILYHKSSYIMNQNINIKKFQTLVNLKSGDRVTSFYLAPPLINESSEYQPRKIVASKGKQEDFIYKVVFQSPALKRINVK